MLQALLCIRMQGSHLASLGLNNTIGATFSAAYVARLTASRPAGKATKQV